MNRSVILLISKVGTFKRVTGTVSCKDNKRFRFLNVHTEIMSSDISLVGNDW